jgi:hypothetical protein
MELKPWRMNTLARIVSLSALLFTSISFSQTWQSVGAPLSIAEATEMDFIVAENGEMYVFYKDAVTNRGRVKTWNGTSWELITPPSFTTVAASNLKIEVKSDGNPVVAWKTTDIINRIRVFSYDGTNWVELGSANFVSDLNKPYDLTVDSNNQVSIVYYNLAGGPGPNDEYIWLDVNPSGQAVVGTILSSYITNSISIAKSTNPFDYWELHGDNDGLNTAALNHFNGSSFSPPLGGGPMHSGNLILSSEAEVRDVNGSEKFVAIYKEDLGPNFTSFVRYYDIGTDTYSSEFTHAAAILESDIAVSSDGFAYTMDEHTGYGITKIDLSTMTGVTYADAFTATTAIDNPRIDTENGVITVAWINEGSGAIEVYEEVIVPTITAIADIDICNGTNYASTDTLLTISGNYDHSSEIYSVTSNNNSVINSGSIISLGTYPNFSLQFPVAAVSSNQVVELTISATSGAGTNSDIIYVNVMTPAIISSVPASICKNEGPLLLNPLASPLGGVWSGSNVANNKFFMSGIAPGAYDLIYTYTDTQGCTGKDTSTITVLSIPDLTLVTTLATCGNEDGTAEVNINSGDAIVNYDVYWSNGESDVSLIDGLAMGAYYVNVTDANNCSAFGLASINSNAFTVTETLTQIDCHDDLDGAIDLTITGTTGPYTRVWSNGQTSEDLTNLSAGVYDVTITDINGCQAVHAYSIDDPGEIFANIEVISADCGLSNGSLEASPAGGTGTLTFQWFDGGGTYINNTNLISSLPGGMYYIVIMDANGCTKLKNGTLNENGGPVVLIDSVINVSCINTGSIYTTINSSAAIASINWSNGSTSQDVTGLGTGFYAIQVEDVNSCIGMAQVELVNSQPDDQIICMVTVDEITNTNRVVWEKPVTSDISHFNIYRETSVLGTYQFVDSVLYADESFFNDTVASPQIRSWRYKISAVDACGNEGELSEIHKTIHLTISAGLTGLVNLAWDQYEGFPYSTFDIYRFTDLTGWELIQSLPANTFALSDVAPSSVGLTYRVVIDPPSVCTSAKATDYNSSRSNRSTTGFNSPGVGVDEIQIKEVSIYPNPTNDNIVITGDLSEGSTIELIDFNGKVIQTKIVNATKIQFSLSQFSDGVYSVKYITQSGVFVEKVIKL